MYAMILVVTPRYVEVKLVLIANAKRGRQKRQKP